MARDRAVVQAFTGDGPILVAIHDVLADLYDLLDARLPNDDKKGPARISEPAPDRPPMKAVPVSEPDPDGEPDRPSRPTSSRPDPPPRTGRGSSLPAWSAWARQAEVQVTADMSRDDIITACLSAGVLSDS